MIVIGSQGSTIKEIGQCAEVKSLQDELLVLENVSIIDTIIVYDCLYLITTYLMVANNSLHVPSMTNNLTPHHSS